MNNINRIKTLGTAIGGGIIGIASPHYGSKLLSYAEDKEEERSQSERDKILYDMKDKVDNLNKDLAEIRDALTKNTDLLASKQENVTSQYSNEIETMTDKLEEGKKSLDTASTTLNESLSENIDAEKVSEGISYLNAGREKLGEASTKLIDLINKINGKSNFMGESELNSFYNFLDGLSLLEESAFIHIIFVLTVTGIIWNIYSILFANEIIKYFNLENKYPKLNRYFKLRKKFQRYYLTLNLIFFLILSFIVICINLLVLYVSP